MSTTSATTLITRLAGISWLLPAIRIALAVAASGSVYFMYTGWRDSLIQEGVVQQQAAQGKSDAQHLAQIMSRLDVLSTGSVVDADSAVAQRVAVKKEVDRLLLALRTTPLAVAGADGVCRPTPEAIRNWNSLQDIVVQQPSATAKFLSWDELMATKLK